MGGLGGRQGGKKDVRYWAGGSLDGLVSQTEG